MRYQYQMYESMDPRLRKKTDQSAAGVFGVPQANKHGSASNPPDSKPKQQQPISTTYWETTKGQNYL